MVCAMIFPRISLFLTVILAATFCGCSSVDMPKGKNKGYESARFVRIRPNPSQTFAEGSDQVNNMIQSAISSEFTRNGLAVGPDNAELIIAYLLIIQNNATTTSINDYFGYGRSSSEILEAAHNKGVLSGKNPDYFEAGAIVIDILDAKSNKLIYRNYAKRDVIQNLSDAERQTRINDAVAEALEPFFK